MPDRSTHLSTWASSDLKQRFAAVAADRALSESAFLKSLVERAIVGADTDVDVLRATPLPRGARMTIRLVPEDRRLLAERAAGRGIPAASYVSILVRSHLRNVTPLPDREHEALRTVVNQLAAVGRKPAALTREHPQTVN